MTVLEIVTEKLDNDNISSSKREMAIEEVEQAIKNYCNINSVPDALKFTWANMAVDLIRYQYASTNKDSGDLGSIDIGSVSSLKIGDTDIKLGGSNDTTAQSIAIKSHKVNVDDIVMNYRQQLVAFRRMVW